MLCESCKNKNIQGIFAWVMTKAAHCNHVVNRSVLLYCALCSKTKNVCAMCAKSLSNQEQTKQQFVDSLTQKFETILQNEERMKAWEEAIRKRLDR